MIDPVCKNLLSQVGGTSGSALRTMKVFSPFDKAMRGVDTAIKKAVEEMGSSQARVKVQTVIEKMRQAAG
jgi:hypothetical protein